MESIDEESLKKLNQLNNKYITELVERYVKLCKPAKTTVITDSEEDIAYVRKGAIRTGEETELNLEGHTVHYDAFKTMKNHDQARDKEHTRILIPEGGYSPPALNTIEREKGLNEVLGIMDGCMEGHECLVRFFSLGPRNSKFTILALQLTDSFYVAHSEDILYRPGYEEFKELRNSNKFFTFIHSQGELTGDPPTTKNLDKRRIYVDLVDDTVLSVNNQYAGNSLGLKKLALRLAINKANQEDWLTEHYFIMGLHPKGKERVTYSVGAFPSGCGKTSTAMLPGQTIVGDDIAYLRQWEDGYCHAVNIESGIFGIIKDVNPKDDPVIYDALRTPRENIFSNVLIHEGEAYWLGMGKEIPEEGFNYSGKWYKGKNDKNGIPIPHSHPNARYTIRIKGLDNADPNLNNPDGVPIQAVFYGGRDSDTMPPVIESLDWNHGVFLGASVESETTAQTLGKEGVRKINPMSNLDFIVVPLGKYIDNHRKFGEHLENPPKVFATNYFLKGEHGKYLNDILDKLVWVMWAEGRCNNDYEAIKTPIGYLPKYPDLKDLFKVYLDKEYTKEEYEKQFAIRIEKILEKLDRVEKFYKKEKNMPKWFWDVLESQRSTLIKK